MSSVTKKMTLQMSYSNSQKIMNRSNFNNVNSAMNRSFRLNLNNNNNNNNNISPSLQSNMIHRIHSIKPGCSSCGH